MNRKFSSYFKKSTQIKCNELLTIADVFLRLDDVFLLMFNASTLQCFVIVSWFQFCDIIFKMYKRSDILVIMYLAAVVISAADA
jgi:hypothetical protein